MFGIGRHLEFPFLFAADAQFLADALDAVNADSNPMIGQVALQALRATRFAGALVCCSNLNFQAAVIKCAA